MQEKKLASPKLITFLDEYIEYLDMPGNVDQLQFARDFTSKYLVSESPVLALPADLLASVTAQLKLDTVPPRDLFAPLVAVALSKLQVNAYRLFTQSSSFQPLMDLKAREEQVPLVTDFKLLQILGEGYEGKVLQARKKDCGICYALKVLDKNILASRSRRWQLHCSRELQCLQACSHPFVVGLAYSFQTPQYLYMVQEYLPNHTLASYLDAHEGRPVDLNEVRFIVAELACGLAHMHLQEILYRDLKPANVLIDDDGHMRIVDMGMASQLDPETKRRKSVCGTKRYMAPEMQAKQPYNGSVDWYSLGKLILDCQGRSQYGQTVEREWAASGLESLVDGLLVKDPAKRLACKAEGVEELKQHHFFKGIDWAVLDMRKMPSPLKRAWYIREPDVAMSRQFRNGEDIAEVISKLQTLALDQSVAGGSGPGMVPNWDYVNPRAVYSEYVSSPYLNYKLPLQF
jgi:serine/threonine protein kinase